MEALYRACFPEEDLVPLLRRLADDPATQAVTLREDARLSGHAVVTTCAVGGMAVGLLGPIAVRPHLQGRGLGRRLVQDAVKIAREGGMAALCVLGDPAFYGRFGFEAETRIEPPYGLPPEWRTAWRSRRFGPKVPDGVLTVARAWRDPALWR